MLRFRFLGFPVHVHGVHLLFSAFFAWSMIQGSTGNPWVAAQLSSKSQLPLLLLLVAWTLLIAVSVLVHELGHAIAYRAFGYASEIELVAMGGLTRARLSEPVPWLRDVVVSTCGPLAGFLFGIAAWAVSRVPLEEGGVTYFFTWLTIINLFWSAVNLLPVTPLDGGRVATAILTRMFGRNGFLLSQVVSLAVAVVAALVFWRWFHSTMGPILFGLWGVRSVMIIAAHLRGEQSEAQAGAEGDPLAEAWTLLGQGQIAAAEERARRVLNAQDGPGLLRDRAHHLLGWIALKRGEGRAALDHFAQTRSRPVENQALAAAFSLIGDEERALPLWELAYKETTHPTVLHEWAGALLRAGRGVDVRRLPGLDLASAYQCGMDVLLLRADYAAAARLGDAGLSEAPNAELAYATACAHARAGNPVQALSRLSRASELGFRDVEAARSDSDLASLRTEPSFRIWLESLEARTGPLA